MKKNLFVLFCLLFSLVANAQITKSNETFTNVSTFDGKVVFIKEIQAQNNDADKNYSILKEWAKVNFAKDPFNSSVHYDDKGKKIIAKSRVELVLPSNSLEIREKMIMKFSLEVFCKGDICIMEITKINFINNKKENSNTLGQKIKAENIITNMAVAINDINKESRINTQKSTLYFVNDLANSLQNVLNNKYQ